MAKTKGTRRPESTGLRRRAEDLLNSRNPALQVTCNEEDTQRLVHELEVHQIELEMQNAALSQSRDEVESALERYTDLYDFSPAGYFTLDRNGAIRATNLTGSSFLGIERSKLIGQPFASFVATESRPQFASFLEKLFAHRGEVTCELTLTKKGHSPIIVQLAALSSESGQEYRVAVIDITRRKKAEEALLVSEKIYRAIGESIDYGIWICAPDGRNIYASQSFLELVGMTQEQCSNFGWGEVLHPDDAEQTIAAWKECVRTSGNWDIEHRYRGVDGQWHYILARGLPVRNDRGEVIYWSGINLDITSRKQTEKALQASELRIQQALRVSRSFTFEWLPDTDQVIRSASCESILKLTGAEAINDIGKNYFQRIHTDDRAGFVQILSDLSPVNDSYMTEYRLIRNDGSEVVLEESGKGTFCADGTLEKLIGVTTDITARKEAELALQRAHDELEQRVRERTADLENALETLHAETSERLKVMEDLSKQEQILLQQSRLAAMGEMLNNIAHQWRQPLNTLGLLVQKLPLFYDSAEFNREFVEKNVAKSMIQIQHMSQTIESFRNFFRSDKAMVIFSLEHLINQTIAFIEITFGELGIKIDLDIENGLQLRGYPNEYAQVLLNILINARDAMLDNKVDDARIILRAFSDGDVVVVTVTDNAGGIPGEVIGRVFDPYFTTKGPDKGTGLGLFMSKTIIEKNMSGRLTVRNTGNGAEFRIEVAHDT